jgi:hypothetical protein
MPGQHSLMSMAIYDACLGTSHLPWFYATLQVYTSWLSRAIETAWLVLDELDALWLPLIKSWRLNERMYGALTGASGVSSPAISSPAIPVPLITILRPLPICLCRAVEEDDRAAAWRGALQAVATQLCYPPPRGLVLLLPLPGQ